MKKKKLLGILAILSILIAITITSLYSFTDYSDTGWYASTGLNTYPGTAYERHQIPGGWAFKCRDNGICYTIFGNWLDIYDGIGSGGENVDVYKY
jgi:hypothetical protein